MFCPLCAAYLTERDLIKKNVKKMGAIDIAYDARCPSCNAEMGRVEWGKLQDDPGLPSAVPTPAAEPQQSPLSQAYAPVLEESLPAQTELTFGRERVSLANQIVPMEASAQYHCPHCGKPLPDDLSQLHQKQ